MGDTMVKHFFFWCRPWYWPYQIGLVWLWHDRSALNSFLFTAFLCSFCTWDNYDVLVRLGLLFANLAYLSFRFCDSHTRHVLLTCCRSLQIMKKKKKKQYTPIIFTCMSLPLYKHHYISIFHKTPANSKRKIAFTNTHYEIMLNNWAIKQ